MNHPSRVGPITVRIAQRVFSEDELHCEPGGFMPSDALEAQGISLTQVEQPFSACAAGYALDPEFFAAMRAL